MENSRRSAGRHEALHVDPHSRDVSMSTNRSQSNDFEFFAPSPGSSVGASVSMLSSRNSEADIGESEELDGVRTIMLHHGVEDMLRDVDIRSRYPNFYKFLMEEDPTWFEPSPIQGTVLRLQKKTLEPRDAPRLRGELRYEMLDLMYRFFRQKHVNNLRKRENEDLKEANRQLRVTSVQIYAKAEQEEEFISNSLLKKIQKLKEDKEYLMHKYQKDEEVLTSDLMANVAKIAEIHQDHCKTEKLVADKQAEIERLQAHCRRAEKNYHDELFRLRAEKVDHESALEQEQELLINTLGKRMSQTNDEKRKMQASLEKAYLNGFVDYTEGVECAFRSSATQKYGMISSPSPTFRTGAPSPSNHNHQATFSSPQLTEAGNMFVENQRLVGLVRSLVTKNDSLEKRENELVNQVLRLQQTIETMKQETRNFEVNVSTRLNLFCGKMMTAGDNVSNMGASTSSMASSSSHPPPNQSIVHPVQMPPTALATVYPIQRSSGSRNDMNTM